MGLGQRVRKIFGHRPSIPGATLSDREIAHYLNKFSEGQRVQIGNTQEVMVSAIEEACKKQGLSKDVARGQIAPVIRHRFGMLLEIIEKFEGEDMIVWVGSKRRELRNGR